MDNSLYLHSVESECPVCRFGDIRSASLEIFIATVECIELFFDGSRTCIDQINRDVLNSLDYREIVNIRVKGSSI